MKVRKKLSQPAFSYRHLYYFWVVGKEGGIARAAARLNVAVQTVSAQVHELERSLGCLLLKPVGRGLVLTDAGEEAMRQAERIFFLGESLPAAVRGAGAPALRLRVGIADGIPKLVVRQLLQPLLHEPAFRLRCGEGKYEDLLGELALHRLDVVLADRTPPPNLNLKLYSHRLGSSSFAWYAAPSLYARSKAGFPKSLSSVPVLLPTTDSMVRAQLDAWFERIDVQPNIKGEFQDSALLKTFGASGLGVFPAAQSTARELTARYRVKHIDGCDGVKETFFAIVAEKRVEHPLIQKLLSKDNKR